MTEWICSECGGAWLEWDKADKHEKSTGHKTKKADCDVHPKNIESALVDRVSGGGGDDDVVGDSGIHD